MRSAIRYYLVITLAVVMLPLSAVGDEHVYYDQLVKDLVGYYVYAQGGVDWIWGMHCDVQGFTPSRTAQIAPGSGDPGFSEDILLPESCEFPDIGGQVVFAFNVQFNSLTQLGTWDIMCHGYGATPLWCPNRCYGCMHYGCTLTCDQEVIYELPDDVYFHITAYNEQPTASISHSPTPAWNQTVTLNSNANDPDGGSLDYSWSITEKPTSSSKTLSSSSAANPTIGFTNDDDIGSWSFRLHVDDDEGERATFTHSFSVPNVEPDISVSGNLDIYATETIALSVTPTTDVDGGILTFNWDIDTSPPGASEAPQYGYSSGSSISIPTTDIDIGNWEFTVTANDDEDPPGTDTESVLVVVHNIPPEIDLVGASEIDIGDAIMLETTILTDADGGDLEFVWDIIQAPQSSLLTVQSAYHTGTGATGAGIYIPTAYEDAGTWIFRLTAIDDDDQPDSEIEAEFAVVVDGPAIADITGPALIGSLSFPLVLSGEDSEDIDSPCIGTAHRCHDTLDGRPVSGITPGIVQYTWYLIDVPFEVYGTYPLGRVDDVFGVSATGSTMSIDYADLQEGDWVFELEVVDAESNTDVFSFNVAVVDETGPPIAILNPTRRYEVDIANIVAEDIVIDGSASFDLDNILIGDPPGPGMGIDEYQWNYVLSPLGCAAPALPAGTATSSFNLYDNGDTIPANCLGLWQIGLMVTDDDSTPKTASTQTTVIIGDCPALLCINYPTNAFPEYVEFSDNTDVIIYYRLDATLYDDPFFAYGMFTELEIYQESDLVTPVYTDCDSNVLASNKGSMLVFHWNGFTDWNARPEPGLYTIKLKLADFSLTFAPFIGAVETNAIWIEKAEPEILPSSDRYIAFNELDAPIPTDTIDIIYDVSGIVVPDQVRWRVYDAATTLIFEHTEVPTGGTISWDGQVSGSTLPPGFYTIEVELLKLGNVLGTSDPHEFVIYNIEIIPITGLVSDTHPGLFVFVNNDDDNLNAVSDLTETAAGENDLIQLDITLDPPLEGEAVFTSTSAAPEPFRLWDSVAKGTETVLGATIAFPATPIPPQLFIEARTAAQSDLSLDIQTNDGVSLVPATIALTLISVQMMQDTNNDHSIGAGDNQIFNVDIARWNNAYDVAFNVNNAADPANFIEQDPRRFYLRIEDASANADAGAIEQITASIGTVDQLLAVDDNQTDVTLTESGNNSGIFIARSAILVSRDIQVVDDPDADDEFDAHDGTAGTVADDAANDRTHRTEMDGRLRIQYQSAAAPAAQEWDLPVCQRNPEQRRRIELRTRIFNEPYLDTGYDHDGVPATPVIGAANGSFDFNDVNMNGMHDAGEASEQFMDISGGAVVFANAGARGGVVTPAVVTDQMTRSNIAWAQACIRFESVGITTVDAPTNAMGVDILADGVFDAVDETFVTATYAPGATVDVVEVFYTASIATANAYTRTPSDLIAGLGENTFIYMQPGLNINFRTLAHELGHAMDNGWDAPNTQVIFYPADNTFTDDAVNQYRRVTDATVANVRTVRPVGNMMATGNRLLKMP